MNNLKTLILVGVLGMLYACQKPNVTDTQSDSKLSNTNTVASLPLNAGGFVSNARNLNIIYFVPSDNPAVSGYKERLSDLLIHFQGFITAEMTRNGYGGKTLGLPLDSTTNRVKIITIQGAQPQANYPYSTTAANAIISEINAYRSTHPQEFSTTYHNLIILPQRTDGGGQPFFGLGRNCFALDNPNISLAAMPTTTSAYIGGLFHELGHGLNLPHNKEKVSEAPVLGTSLMGSGNSTYGKTGKKTFLSEGDCAILFRNELFQPSVVPGQYGSLTTNVSLTEAYYNTATSKMVISGTFTSNQTLANVLYYFDPVSSPTNTDHDSPMWVNAPSGNTFHIEMPVSDLHSLGNTSYNFTIRLLAENGNISAKGYSFSFVNGIPKFAGNTTTVTQNCSYGGYNITLPYGSYTTAELIALGVANNDVSGIKVPMTGVRVRLYDQDNFAGTPLLMTASADCLAGSYGFNDKTSSVIVEPYGGGGTAKFYKHCSYGGYEVELPVGGYTTAELVAKGISDNDISGALLSPNIRVTLYDQDYFKGSSYVLNATNSCITSFNDKASSVLIEYVN
ncbi:hypothetical protein ACR79M_16140 [Sphingobacterium spiritivorum]|uniref:hypothetical protein n=1 Tax=Sphingobacterium TaxID=28453 RepID=UPI0025EABEF1|nr:MULTISPECIES: hypothetical protein [unclassified Sphingobacterium]